MGYGLGIVAAIIVAVLLQVFRKDALAQFLLVLANFFGGVFAIGAAVAWVLSAKLQMIPEEQVDSAWANLFAANFAYASALLFVVPYCVALLASLRQQWTLVKTGWQAPCPRP